MSGNFWDKMADFLKQNRAMWFIYGIVFAHFGMHVVVYKKGEEVVAAIDKRIDPEVTFTDKAKTVLTFGLVGDL